MKKSVLWIGMATFLFMAGVLSMVFADDIKGEVERPGEIPEERQHLAEPEKKRELNVMPESLTERLRFPVEEQAFATADWSLEFPDPDADLREGALVGLEEMPERQLYFNREGATQTRAELRDTKERRFDEPVTVLLSKSRYPFEDRHLDAVVWTTAEEEGWDPQGHIIVRLKDGEGSVLSEHGIDELSRSGLFFSVGFPPQLKGEDASLEVVWNHGEEELGRAAEQFAVEEPADVPQSGRIPLDILNEPEVDIQGAPMTVGVPFPRGALVDESNVRLVDEHGDEVPLQTRVTAKWSRFGPIKWLLCDFSADLEGQPRELYLQYGPDVQRAQFEAMQLTAQDEGFPALNTGRIRIGEEGVEFDAAGDGDFVPVLDKEALYGAFVVHENASEFTVPHDVQHSVEEMGCEKAVIRRTGWYENEENGGEFCQFVTRFVFHRGSPIVRIFHTWIFTGDGNRDRITDMGWRFDSAGSLAPDGFLTSFEDGTWAEARNLVQFDYQKYNLLSCEEVEREGRTPGVMSGAVEGTRVTFGAKDFWQNFPSELEMDEGGLTFYNWPRHNPAATFERPVAREDAFRHRFVHEGEVLDFQIPQEYAEGEIWEEACSREGHWAEGKPESANAQGIARTEEMFLHFADGSALADETAGVIQGLNDETIRAVADPEWVAASGVFGNIHHRDPENYPKAEEAFDEGLKAPARWVERLGFYGMWLHGDYPTWNLNLDRRTVSTYRTLRKNHHAYPYRWLPFARSGDPELLKLAEKAVRQMTDANFCHYATEDVDNAVGPDHFRRQGWWDRSLLPWAGRSGPHLRSYTVDSDYLWDAYYMTGYARAKDVALLFGELTQHDHRAPSVSMPGRTRTTESMLTSYLDMYRATFDPWFLAAAHEIGDVHSHLYGDVEQVDKFTSRPDKTGHTWREADQEFYRFTGSEEDRHMALNNAIAWTSPRAVGARLISTRGWGGARIGLSAFAWELTGDDFYVGRVAAGLESSVMSMYLGDVEYLRGVTGTGTGHGSVPTGWAGIGRALWVLEQAEEIPEPVHNPFLLSADQVGNEDYNEFRMPEVFVRKDEDKPVPLHFDARGRGRDGVEPPRQYEPYSYEISSMDSDAEFSGTWRAPARVDIPADAPRGVYRVELTGRIAYPDDLVPSYGETEGAARSRFQRRRNRLFLPASRPDTPEVIRGDRDEDGTSVAAPGLGYWFRVPEEVEEFWIEFTRGSGYRVSLWNPDGERVFDHSYTDSLPDRVEVEVPTEHAGEFWRATGGSFTIDPRIPPYFSVRRGKWLNLEQID